MSSILGPLNQAISLTARLKDISKNLQDAEFANLLADLRLELSEVKLKLADVMDENAKLKSEITRLKHEKQVEVPDLVYRGYAYFEPHDAGGLPYCPGCYDGDNKRIRLKKTIHHLEKRSGSHQCPVCKQFFGK